MVEHVVAEWQQGVIIRYQGFPHFHWLQSQTGTGAFGCVTNATGVGTWHGDFNCPWRATDMSDWQRTVARPVCNFQGPWLMIYKTNGEFRVCSD